MLYRFLIETYRRGDEEATEERLRELGLECWDLVTVLPGSQKDPNDTEQFTFFFRRDATTDINL